MSLSDRDALIIIVICSIVGFLLFVFIICFFLWLIIRNTRSKSTHFTVAEAKPSATNLSQRPHFQRADKISSEKIQENRLKRKKTRRFNTNDSAISFSFEPPHLINQNVKNLSHFLNNEATISTNSWHYEQTPKSKPSSSTEPVYASSSTVLTSISNFTVPNVSTTNVHQRFLDELDFVLRLKNDEQQQQHPLKYSQSCRQRTENLPFDYYRLNSPTLLNKTFFCNQQNTPESLHTRTTNYSNATLIRKAKLGQLTDDTAILY